MADATETHHPLRPVRVGIVLSILSVLLGFGLGALFGGYEREMKDYLTQIARPAGDTPEHPREVKAKNYTKKAMGYVKRSHMHGGGIGATALALCLMLGLLNRIGGRMRSLVSAALGAGALGYSTYWLLAGLRTASMGGAGPAKQSLEWLAVPSAGLLIVGVAASLALFIWQMFFMGPEEVET